MDLGEGGGQADWHSKDKTILFFDGRLGQKQMCESTSAQEELPDKYSLQTQSTLTLNPKSHHTLNILLTFSINWKKKEFVF